MRSASQKVVSFLGPDGYTELYHGYTELYLKYFPSLNCTQKKHIRPRFQWDATNLTGKGRNWILSGASNSWNVPLNHQRIKLDHYIWLYMHISTQNIMSLCLNSISICLMLKSWPLHTLYMDTIVSNGDIPWVQQYLYTKRCLNNKSPPRATVWFRHRWPRWRHRNPPPSAHFSAAWRQLRHEWPTPATPCLPGCLAKHGETSMKNTWVISYNSRLTVDYGETAKVNCT